MDSQMEHPAGEYADQQPPQEKKSVMNKVKAKAKKIKKTFGKHSGGGAPDNIPDHGHVDEQHGRGYHQVGDDDVDNDNDDDDDGVDDDDEVMEEDHEVHGAPAKHESAAVKHDIPKQDVNKGEPKVNFGKVDVMDRVSQSPANSPAWQEGNQGGIGGDSGGRSTVLKEDPHAPKDRRESHDPQTKVTDPTGAGGGGGAGIAPIVKSFEKMSFHDEPESKSHQNPPIDQNILPTSHSPHTDQNIPSTRSHDQFSPELSPSTKRDDQPHDHTTSDETPQNQSSGGTYTEKLTYATSALAGSAMSAKNVVATKLGYGGGKDDNVVTESREGGEKETAKSPSQVGGYGKTIATKLGYGGKDDNVTESREGGETETAKSPSTLGGYGKTISTKLGFGGKDDNVTESRERGETETAKSPSTLGGYGKTISTKLGFGGKDDNVNESRESGETETAKSPSQVSGYGKTVATKLTPVYNTVAGAGTTIMSKVTGPGTGTGTDTTSRETESGVEGQDKGVSGKQSWVEKLKPGEEDKALSKSISEVLHKRKDEGTEPKDGKPTGKVFESEEVAKRLGTGEHSEGERLDSDEVKVNAADPTGANKGMVNMVKGAVGSWFGKGEVEHGQEGTEERKQQESNN